MGRYILKRLGISLVTIWILATLVFILIRLLPGDPFTDEKMPIEIKERMMEYYGLNDPWLKQYTTYMGNLLQGDLGYSLRYKNRSVNNILGDAFPLFCRTGDARHHLFTDCRAAPGDCGGPEPQQKMGLYRAW